MFLPVTTSRDILVFRQNDSCLTIAADTLGAIGEKPADLFCASTELCGRMTARVCLMETLSVGARPFSLMALTCNEREPTGIRLLAGIREELASSGYPDILIGGSTEDNMPTPMTALGVALLGECKTPAWRLAQQGDGVYLLGRPYVGAEVLAHLDELPAAFHVQQLRSMPAVGDIIPCGSRGIAWELHVLEVETGLQTKLENDLDLALLGLSAGPATCVVVTSREPLSGFDGLITKLGSLIRI
jgi:thiamine monophosphate kinase